MYDTGLYSNTISSYTLSTDIKALIKVLVIKAPGGCPADPRDLPYKNLKLGTRLGPKGPPFLPNR